MEAVHAREDIELFVKKRLEAFLTLVARVNLDASVSDCSKLVFELLSI
jgi:hypothetical protein